MSSSAANQGITASDLTSYAYETNFSRVLFVLEGFRLPETEVEDLAQDVFVAYFKHCLNIQPGRERAWLIVSARNMALTALQKRNRRGPHLNVDTDVTLEAPALCPLEEDHAERCMRIQAGLRTSQAGALKVLCAHYVHNKPVKVIAQERGMKVSSVTSALHRQRKTFGRLIGERRCP
jgi:RNA polymerase sigma factor (sigma-70 family)